jgi:two-component system response regulator AtoC
MDNRIIVIDDEQDFLESIRRGLITSGFTKVTLEHDPINAASHFSDDQDFDIALIDVTMPGMDGLQLLEAIKTASPRTECIMVTAVDEARIAIKSLRKGAYDYLVKPISKEDLVLSINRALERKKLVDILDLAKTKAVPRLVNVQAFKPIITASEKIFRILKEAELHAVSDVPVLITGETGTGKELLAKAIHNASPRSESHFTPINMDGMTSHLFDAEFFGHTKGAFTGAERDRAGYLETTNKGTLFLDEIGNLPLELQGKLLRVLQDGEFIKLGTSRPQRTDVRFIAATNKDLEKMLIKKQFRKDLYYRLKGGWIHLPPLKERKDDIPLLISSFIEKCCGPDGTNFEEEALSLLLEYNYPGNIRELKSIIHATVNLAQGKPITTKFLPIHLRKKTKQGIKPHSDSNPVIPLDEVEKAHILRTYNQMKKNKSQTARALGIGLNTLRRKLDTYGVG